MNLKLQSKPASKTECVELIISIICDVNGEHISKTDKRVLSYFIVYGLKESTEKLLIDSKIVTDMPALRNAKSRLMRMKFLRRTETLYKSYELNLNGNLNIDKNMGIFIKIDNS